MANDNLYTNPRTPSHVRRVLASIKSNASELDAVVDGILADYVSAASTWGASGLLVESAADSRALQATAIETVDVVTAVDASAGANLLIESAGADKTIQDTSIETGDVVTAADASAGANLLIESAGADKTIQDTSIETGDVVTAASGFGVDESIIIADGTSKATQASAFNESDLVQLDEAYKGLHSDVIYYESFIDVAGDGDLHATAPKIASTSAASVWTAHTNFNKDGTMDGGSSGAFLPFVPQPGFRYYLELEISSPVSGGTAGEGVVFGYGEALPADAQGTTGANYFSIDNTTGKATCLISNETSTQPNALQLGTASDGFDTVINWTNTSVSLDEDLLRVRLVLDASPSDGVYTTEVLAKRDQDREWLDASPKNVPLLAQDIGIVGFATTDASTTTVVKSFLLWSERIDSEAAAVEPIAGGNMIYHAAFSGFSQDDLDGRAPNVAPDGVTWQAHNTFQANGVMGSNAGAGAYLPFAPEAGRVYYFDLHMNAVEGGVDGYGILAGFVEDVSSTADDTGTDAFMAADPTTGKFIARMVNPATTADNLTYLGTASAGLSNIETWTDTTLAQDHDEKFVRLVLDTSWADGTYRGTCFAKLAADEQWTQVSTIRPLVAQDITAIGLASIGSTVTTKFNSLTLWYEDVKTPKVTETYGAGTAYTLTNSAAAVDFGTTDPVIVLTREGEYKIQGWCVVNYVGATYASADLLTLTLRRTNNTAANLTNGTVTVTIPVMTTLTDAIVVAWEASLYTTNNVDDSLTIFASVGTAPGAGSVTINQAFIKAELIT